MRNVTLILDDGSRFSGKSFGYEKPVAGEVVFMPSGHQNFQVYDKSSGDLVDERHVNGGSYGGVLPLKNGMVIAGTGGSHGMRGFFPDGAGILSHSR